MANEGDPHIRTVDGVNYDFQAAGEFVVARSADGFEVQIRQTAIPTTFFPGPNSHTGLATCVSVNSAVAVRVGKHRVTFQPRLEGEPDPSGMELRVDGVLTALVDDGVRLPRGGRVLRSAVGGMEIEFPSGALLTATPAFWSSQGVWYVNVNVTGAEAYEGIMGAISRDGWLPALPDGSSLGPKPGSLSERYDQLYHKFGDAWRVTKETSLFDYASGTSTEDFTLAEWPKDSPPCELPQQNPAEPVERPVAERACRALIDNNRRENCIFDVEVTGETGFAKTYLLTERLERWGTTTILASDLQPSQGSKPVGFVATVASRWLATKDVPAGSVQFYLHGERAGEPVRIDETGRAFWAPDRFDWQNYRVWARYVPENDSPFLTSISEELSHPDRGNIEVYQAK